MARFKPLTQKEIERLDGGHATVGEKHNAWMRLEVAEMRKAEGQHQGQVDYYRKIRSDENSWLRKHQRDLSSAMVKIGQA